MSMLPTDLMIKQLCIRTGEPGFHNYSTIEGYMLDAVRDLNIYTMPCWSVATIPLSPFNTAQWPCDLVKPLITCLKRDGHFHLLEVSDDLIATQQPPQINEPRVKEDCEAKDIFQIDGFLAAYGWSIWSWGLGELYGAETMRPPFGYVIHNYKNRNSFIRGVRMKTGDECVMFFKSDGVANCPMFIPSEAKDVVDYYILQKYYEIPNPNLAASMMEKYKERVFRLSRFLDDNSEDSWIRAMSSNTKSTPKFT